MKFKTKLSIAIVATVALATLAYASFSGSTRLRDGGTNGALHIAYSRDSGTSRFAFLKRDSSTGTYQVYAAGSGITGDLLCSSGLFSCTRPAISRDGKIVTFWAVLDPNTDGALRAYYYLIGGSGAPITTTASYSNEIPLSNDPGAWPPQATNVRSSDSSFKILFVNRGTVSLIYGPCSNAPSSGHWKLGQLHLWDGGASSGTTIVTTAVGTTDGCLYLAQQEATEDGNKDSPAICSEYTINNADGEDGYKVSWSATAFNQMSGVTQDHQQIIFKDQSSGTRELISKNSSGTAGNDYSGMQSMTGDAGKFAFSSLATNLTAYSDTNGKYDVFRRDRSGNTTIAAYSLALNNVGTPPDGNSLYPVISGNGSFVAFHSYSTGIAGTYYSSRSPSYPSNSTPFAFMARFTSNPGTTELASYLAGTPADWRTGLFPSVNYDGSAYGFHSVEGDLATTSQSASAEDIYEMTGFS